MAKKKSGPLLITQTGTAMWTNVRKPDQKYGKHGLSLQLDKGDEKNDALVAELNDLHKEAGGGAKRAPAKDGAKMRNKDDEPYEGLEDKWVLKFGSKFPIETIVDAQNQPIPKTIDVFSGDRVQVAFVTFDHGEGVTLKVNAIRVIEKGGMQQVSADVFGAAVEGGFVAPEVSDDEETVNPAADNGDF